MGEVESNLTLLELRRPLVLSSTTTAEGTHPVRPVGLKVQMGGENLSRLISTSRISSIAKPSLSRGIGLVVRRRVLGDVVVRVPKPGATHISVIQPVREKRGRASVSSREMVSNTTCRTCRPEGGTNEW